MSSTSASSFRRSRRAARRDQHEVEAVLPAQRAGDDRRRRARGRARPRARSRDDDDGVRRDRSVPADDASQRLVRRAPGRRNHSMRAPTARRWPARNSRAAMVRRPSGRSSRMLKRAVPGRDDRRSASASRTLPGTADAGAGPSDIRVFTRSAGGARRSSWTRAARAAVRGPGCAASCADAPPEDRASRPS